MFGFTQLVICLSTRQFAHNVKLVFVSYETFAFMEENKSQILGNEVIRKRVPPKKKTGLLLFFCFVMVLPGCLSVCNAAQNRRTSPFHVTQ